MSPAKLASAGPDRAHIRGCACSEPVLSISFGFWLLAGKALKSLWLVSTPAQVTYGLPAFGLGVAAMPELPVLQEMLPSLPPLPSHFPGHEAESPEQTQRRLAEI